MRRLPCCCCAAAARPLAQAASRPTTCRTSAARPPHALIARATNTGSACRSCAACATRARSSKTRRSPSTCRRSARASSPRPPATAQRFQFFVVRDDTINAFALPGGFIGVNYGLVLATRNESELAGVLAHEIAHVTQRHIARTRARAGPAEHRARWPRSSPRSWSARRPASQRRRCMGGDRHGAGRGHAAADQLHARQRERGRSRRHRLPRRRGLRSLRHAGLLRDHGPAHRAQRRPQCNAGNPAVASGHHQPHRRIARARRAVQGPAARRRRASSYALMRERLRVLVDARRKTTCGATTPSAATTRTRPCGERYGEALASYQAGNSRAALDTLTEPGARVPAGAHAAVHARPGADGRRAPPTRRSPPSSARWRCLRATCRSPCATPKRCSRPARPRPRTPCCWTCSTTWRRRRSRSASRRWRRAAPATRPTRPTT